MLEFMIFLGIIGILYFLDIISTKQKEITKILRKQEQEKEEENCRKWSKEVLRED